MYYKDTINDKNKFNKIYKKGKSVPHRFVIIFYKKNFTKDTNVAFVASKKVGKAVTRNRARRIMRQSIYNLDCNIEGYDIIFVARNTIVGKKCQEVQKSIKSAIKKTEMLK